MKRYFIISGLHLRDNNRGTAALGYGAFTFLIDKGFITNNQDVMVLVPTRSLFKKDYIEEKCIQGATWRFNYVYIHSFETRFAKCFNYCIPFLKLWRTMKKISFVAAINGGDGFSDIYGTSLFHYRLPESLFAMSSNVPLIQLPQTLGPFADPKNYALARRILKYSQKVYVRDLKYVEELKKIDVEFEVCKDLSAYMKPEPWEIELVPGAVGINVSGLAYSNTFQTLAGQFSCYPELIDEIICYFQNKKKTVYLIPHSYNYKNPEESNDDLEACKLAYNHLKDKTNVIVVDYDMTAPQVKFVISKMSFFCGTRMHANFAAIYSKVPVFGLAYSYKFEGAFNNNGLDGERQTALINNINKGDINAIMNKLDDFYKISIVDEN